MNIQKRTSRPDHLKSQRKVKKVESFDALGFFFGFSHTYYYLCKQKPSNDTMKTTIHEENSQLIAILEGRLDTSVSEDVEQKMSPLLNCTDKDIVIDCTGLTYISSSGLRIFLAIVKSAKVKKKPVYIKGMSVNIRSVLAMAGLLNLFIYI